MNGISLAALLGAATWFGSTVGPEDEAEKERDDRPLPTPDDSLAEIESRDNDFLWPPGPMFQ